MMIDWVTAQIQAAGIPPGVRLYDTGQVLRLAPGGEVEQAFAGKLLLEGSHDSRLLVKSTGQDLYISGNVVKHVQGHNLYGPDDPVGLFFDAGERIRQALGLFPSPATWESCGFEGPRFTRLDLTRSYRFPNAADARTWIREVAARGHTRHGNSILKGSTMYFGKGSERWSFKVYHKADELTARGKLHQLPAHLVNRDRLLEWAQGVLRFELQMRSKELDKWNLAETTPLSIWQTYFERITWNRNAMATKPDLIEHQLPGRLQVVLIAWRAGTDIRSMYARPTFYRYRKEILEGCGIDIAADPPSPDQDKAGPGPDLDRKGWDPEPLTVYPGNLNSKTHYLHL